MIGDLISGGLKLLGGFLDRDANKDANKQALANAQAERDMQLQFAKNAIQWKVNDAQLAGVHPLFAMGASTSSYAPQSIGLKSESVGSAFADMGQDVSRAMSAGPNADAKKTLAAQSALTLEGMKLDNDIKRAKLASDVQKLSTPATVTAGPVPEADKYEDRPKLRVGDTVINTDPKTTNAEDFEKRYGEVSDWVFGPQVLYRDVMGETEPFFSEKTWSKIKAAIGSIIGTSQHRR